MSGVALKVSGLTKSVKDRVIVNDLSFQISPGEIVGFVGPNGAGKTTTMRMIVGLVSPTQGEIQIQGHSVPKEFTTAMRYVGGMIEGPQMYGYLTGYQNLIHYARMVTGVTKERIDEVVSLVGLTGRIHDKVKVYSLGMKQRLGLAQAVLHSPTLLILDEPTNGLDPNGIREINSYLRRLADEHGVSIFVSSHILSEMGQVCDRILFIQDGKIIDEHQQNKATDVTEEISVEFIIDSTDKAKEYLEKMHPDRGIVVKENRIIIDIPWDDIAVVNKQLVEQGIAVSGVQRIAGRLEDKYLEITGGKTEC